MDNNFEFEGSKTDIINEEERKDNGLTMNEKEKKETAEICKYEDIEMEFKRAYEQNNKNMMLLLNELTLARNVNAKNGSLSRSDKKEFDIAFSAFKDEERRIVKRAGVYNTNEINADQAEDGMIEEDFNDARVLIVDRNCIFLKEF